MKKISFFFAGLSVILCGSLTYSSEIVIPAAQIMKGKGVVVIYYTRANQDLNLQVSNKDEIKVNNSSYFSEVTNDFKCNGNANSVLVKAVINPVDEGFYYWLKAGSGSYDLEIPSASVRNKLSGRNLGTIVGLGMRSQLFPDTIVTPALAIEMGGSYSVYDLDVFKSGSDPNQSIANRFEVFEAQISCLISKKIRKFEPFGGLKIARTFNQLRQLNSQGSVSGAKDNAGVFAGARYYVHSNETVVIEGGFVGETSLTIGWNINF